MLEKIIIVMLFIVLLVIVLTYWNLKTYLEDIHGHLWDDDADRPATFRQSFMDGWNEEAEREEKQKVSKKKNAK